MEENCFSVEVPPQFCSVFEFVVIVEFEVHCETVADFQRAAKELSWATGRCETLVNDEVIRKVLGKVYEQVESQKSHSLVELPGHFGAGSELSLNASWRMTRIS